MQLIASLILTLAVAATSGARSTPVRARQDEPERTYESCGGFVIDPKECAEGYQCIQDPRKPDQPTDLPGICVPVDFPQCAGLINLECFPGSGPPLCLDWPNDDCDPEDGGADCIGICMYPL